MEPRLKRTKFHYRVEAVVELTGRDLAVMMHLASCHYDGRCKSIFTHGGFGYGWLMMLLHDVGDESNSLVDFDLDRMTPELAEFVLEVVLTGQQVDQLRKTIEYVHSGVLTPADAAIAAKLKEDLGRIFREMNDESRRLHGKETA